MTDLLDDVIAAHGGMEAWRRVRTVDADIVSGGGFFALKGIDQDADTRRISISLHEQRASLHPYGAPDQLSVFTPDRVAVETLDGRVLGERFAPRDSFAGHQMSTLWDPLHRAYFNGEALWTYFTTPFLLTMPGVAVEEADAWQEGEESWRVLRARFPGAIETHSQTQDFYFGPDLMLRRHDYQVNVAGGFPAAQLVSDYVAVEGLRLPTRRRAYVRGPDRQPVREMLMVWIDIANVRFE
ncbi:hypothetical protein [Sphingosinicella sp. BN140058]|uniref:hypothetical protein n=1 Tax=Sphingosinicella sp. BN140058 TaxID=1892855 RepID=UPI001010247A|nr:hypothetical protein [Sphingosinicella sp. BN140058]QAY79074.1 hypothetical protein ETR14_22940 [Sphingosinicella sp. BN140058]